MSSMAPQIGLAMFVVMILLMALRVPIAASMFIPGLAGYWLMTDTATSLTVLIFDNEDDYARGDAALNAMPRGDTPGSRTSVRKYQVAIRQTM